MNRDWNTRVAQGSAGKWLLEKFLLAFMGVAVLIAMLAPEHAYARYEPVRVFADWVALHFNAINEFSAASQFPGVTRVVLALVWCLVVPAALIIWLYPGMLRSNERQLRRLGILGRLVWFVFLVAFIWILPNAITLEGSGKAEAFMRIAGVSRLALGITAGVYCALVAFILALVPRLMDPRYYFQKWDPRRA